VIKVVYLSPLPASGEAAVSGVPKISQTLLRAFEKMPEIEVEAITLVDGLEKEFSEKRGQVRYHYLACKNATLYSLEMRRLISRVHEYSADVVHAQPTAEYLLAATGCGRPHVITIHGLEMREGWSVFREGFLAGAVREFLQRRAIRNAANIISNSSYVADYIRGRTTASIWPVANPIDEDFFEIPPPERRRLRMLCVGLVSRRKNQRLLVEACGLLAGAGIPFECQIIGKAARGYETEIRGMIGRLGIERQVVMTGLLSHSELIKRYEWATAVVLPSLEETSPLSLIQAMAAGRPVFGADAAGIPTLLEGGSLGTLFPPFLPEALAEGLKMFSANPAPFWQMAALAQSHARTQFEPLTVARKTLEVYQNVLSVG
jgi:glycosyltransferase involved in cell wall biosynthesis